MNLNTLLIAFGISFFVFAITIAGLWRWTSINFSDLNREHEKLKMELEYKLSHKLTTIEGEIYQIKRRDNIQIDERLNSLLKFLEIEEFFEPSKQGFRKKVKDEEKNKSIS